MEQADEHTAYTHARHVVHMRRTHCFKLYGPPDHLTDCTMLHVDNKYDNITIIAY